MTRDLRRALVAAAAPIFQPLENRVLFDTNYFPLAGGPLQQNWNNTGLITAANDYSAVPSITGFRGDRVANNAGADPRMLLDDSIPGTGNPVNVTPNQTDPTSPTTNTSGGLYEFEDPNSTGNPVVGYQGSGTADAPFLKIYLNTTGQASVPVSYNLRDLDTSDTAVQQFVAQYRVGTTGDYTSIELSYVADASADGGATLVTPVSFNLPAAALNQAQVELRIITADAIGSDAMIGVDDIVVGGVAANTFNFDPSNYSVNEAAGTVTLTVTRGDTTAAASVLYSTANGSATAGNDFTPISNGTLNFAAGVGSRTFTVSILNDTVAEALEQFTVTLSGPTGGTLGSSPTATVLIADNDVVAPTGLLVNEVSTNPPGTDVPNEYIELRGTPGQTLLGVYALSVEGDATANAGAITAAFDLSSGTVGSNGLLFIGGATRTLTLNPATGVVTNALFDVGTGGVLQNGANSFLIIFSPGAVPSGDIDVNNDGTIDNLPAGATLLDGVGYVTATGGVATAGDIAYGAVLPPLASALTAAVPDAITRFPTNTTPFASAAFYGGDLEGADNTSVTYITTDPTRLTSNTPVGAVLTPGGANFGAGDTTAPTAATPVVVSTSLPQSISITFSEDVSASFTPSDALLFNTTTNSPIPSSSLSSFYNPVTNTLTLTYNAGALPEGAYTFTIAAANITDAAGNPLAANVTRSFTFFRGDLDNSGTINNADIAPFVLGLTNPTGFQAQYGYSPTLLGDCNLDGVFNNADIAAFVAKLTSGRPVATPAATDRSTPPAFGEVRVTADVLNAKGSSRVATLALN